MSRTVKYLFIVLVVSAMLSGCFEGPTGPQGTQGEQGKKGDPGSGTIITLKHLVRSSEVTLESISGFPTSYFVTIKDPFFEIDCDYSMWVYEIGYMVKVDSFGVRDMFYFNLAVADGKMGFFADSDWTGKLCLFIKCKP